MNLKPASHAVELKSETVDAGFFSGQIPFIYPNQQSQSSEEYA